MSDARLEFNINCIVNNVWYPSELKSLGTSVDDLSPSQKPLFVENGVKRSLRPSIVDAPFETLQALWSPLAPPPIFDGASVEADFSCEYVAVDGKAEGRIRVCSKFEKRAYRVERSQAQFCTLLEAMRTTFPHLITLDASLCSYGGSFFCAMLKKHIAELFSYLPLMYFLFEKDDKSTGNFFSALEDTLKTVKNSENNVITAFKPKESRGWFSFGSKQKVQTYSIAEDVEFIEANNNLLPSNFKPLFFRFVAQKSNFSETNKIIEDLSGQIASESPILKNCLQSLQSVVVAAESSEAPLRDLRREVDFQDNEVKCILGSVVRSSNSLYAIISSIEKFLIDFLHLLRTVSENMPYINGGKKVPKDFPAYEHKSLFIKGGELFKAYALSVKTWEERLEKELGYAEVELNAKKKELCICIFNLLTARANSVNANSF